MGKNSRTIGRIAASAAAHSVSAESSASAAQTLKSKAYGLLETIGPARSRLLTSVLFGKKRLHHSVPLVTQCVVDAVVQADIDALGPGQVSSAAGPLQSDELQSYQQQELNIRHKTEHSVEAVDRMAELRLFHA